MPPTNEFQGRHQRIRWAKYLASHLDGAITKTALADELGLSVSRISQQVKAARGINEETAWDMGRALRVLGANTNELEALWAGGFFAELLRVIHLIAADVKNNGPKTALLLFCALPARMLNFELELMQDAELPENGRRYLAEYQAVIKSGNTHTEETDFDFDTRTHTPRSVRKIAAAVEELSRPERFTQYDIAHIALTRGEVPKGDAFSGDGTWSIGTVLRGDDDIIDMTIEAAKKRGSTWVPSLLVVRLWRMANEWVHDLALDSTEELDLIPDLFIPIAAQRQRTEYLDAVYSEMAYDRHAP